MMICGTHVIWLQVQDLMTREMLLMLFFVWNVRQCVRKQSTKTHLFFTDRKLLMSKSFSFSVVGELVVEVLYTHAVFHV